MSAFRFHVSRWRSAKLAGLAVPAVLGIASVARAADEPIPPPPPPTTSTSGATTGSGNDPKAKPALIPPEVDPKKDLDTLAAQGGNPSGAQGTPDAKGSVASGGVFADDWWRHTRPIVEIHGFFRTRAELFHNFSLGRIDPVGQGNGLFPRPLDDTWADTNGAVHGPAQNGCGPTSNPAATPCTQKTNASANIRMRIDPEIHISDNLRIMTQIDLLDNLVLGSTPDGYSNYPSGNGYASNGGGGYVPLRSFSTTQVPPVAGVNGYSNSIAVKRVWGEFTTPIGQLRFGRMPSHWGLGILANSGDRIDSDWQSTADRILFVTGSKALDLYVAGAWDFPNTGRTSAYGGNPGQYLGGGQPYNTTQLENTAQWVFAVFRKVRPEIAAQKLARGDAVINGGMYSVYRQQILDNESVNNSISASPETYQKDLTRIGAKAFIPDLWLQILTKHLRWETEFVYIYGSIENPQGALKQGGPYTREDWKIRQVGLATEFEYRALNDDLKLRFYSGFASGDQGVTSLDPGSSGLQTRQTSDHTVSTFRFHPDYRVDLILWRNILSRVEGAYYFRPGVEYDFTKNLEGERFGGRAEIIWSRASKFVQTPGHKADLGIELDLSVYYQSKDGSLNDDPSKIGGFFAMLQYGVLFPLGGLGYMSAQHDSLNNTPDVSTAQIVRIFLGIAY